MDFVDVGQQGLFHVGRSAASGGVRPRPSSAVARAHAQRRRPYPYQSSKYLESLVAYGLNQRLLDKQNTRSVLAAPGLFLWQGMFYLIAQISSTAISEALMAELLIVGGLMITGSGLGLLNLKDCKTLNLLPSLLVPVIWFLLRSLWS